MKFRSRGEIPANLHRFRLGGENRVRYYPQNPRYDVHRRQIAWEGVDDAWQGRRDLLHTRNEHLVPNRVHDQKEGAPRGM